MRLLPYKFCFVKFKIYNKNKKYSKLYFKFKRQNTGMYVMFKR